MVIDTSIFIEFLRSKRKRETQLFKIPETSIIYISSVTLYELIMGATTDDKMRDIETLTQGIPVLPFDEDVSKKAGEIYHSLRRKNKMIDFRDIFIAATCLVNNQPLFTLNDKHFDRIDSLLKVDKF